MAATDEQVKIAMQERSRGKTQQQAAAKADLKSRQTVAKYEGLEQLPSQRKPPRTHRTRPNPFADDWALVEERLAAAPELDATALFTWLCEQRQGQYQAGQLRTFQRHVSTWKALNLSQVAMLPQVRQPGEALQTDGTWLTELGVTIQGAAFKHLLIHSVLPYSNWEWGRIAQSESLAAVQLGLQSTLSKLGYVPRYHQTDNSSAATRNLGIYEDPEDHQERPFTAGYLHLLDHFGLEPRVIHVGNPNENGDIESANGRLKRALEQHLLLRGHRDFDSLDDYEQFLFSVMDQRNRLRQARLNEEIAVMKPLKASKLATRKRVTVRVNRASLIQIDKKTYSVPTGLIEKQVTVYLHEWTLEVYLGTQHVESIPRIVGDQPHRVNYRHVIDSLLRKPGGFRNYRYRDDLFPQLVFRRAWERLDAWYAPRQADLHYLQILKLAARTLEADVALALERLLESHERFTVEDVTRLLAPEPIPVPQVEPGTVDLAHYDQLLLGGQ
jgi:hypothetical protein